MKTTMRKNLLRLGKDITKKVKKLDNIFGVKTGFLDEELDNIMDLVAIQYDIELDPFDNSGDDAMGAILDYWDGDLFLTEVDKTLLNVQKKQNKTKVGSL